MCVWCAKNVSEPEQIKIKNVSRCARFLKWENILFQTMIVGIILFLTFFMVLPTQTQRSINKIWVNRLVKCTWIYTLVLANLSCFDSWIFDLVFRHTWIGVMGLDLRVNNIHGYRSGLILMFVILGVLVKNQVNIMRGKDWRWYF